MKCISPFKMRKHSGKWQEHPSTPFTSVLESCHSSRVNGHLSSLTKEHKVSKSPDVPRWRHRGERRARGQNNHHLATVCRLSVRNIPSNCISLLPKAPVESQVSMWGTGAPHTLSWAFIMSICFLILSPSPLASPLSVCLVSPWVRLVRLHAGRQPVSLSSF